MGELIVTVFVGAVLVWGVLIFNHLVRDRNRTRAAWSDIDVQLQRRHDLIPQLVEAVRAYSGYEKATLMTVTELRSRSEAAERLAEKASVEQEIETGLHRLIALAESYPDLKASQNFLDLQNELSDTEDQLQYARRYYNGAVRNFNTRIQSFPDIVIARVLQFREAEFFDAWDEAAAPPRIELSS